MIEEFIRAIYGDNKSIVMLMSKDVTGVRHRPFNYPEEIDRMVRFIQDMDDAGADVYLNMSLFQKLQHETKWEVKAEKQYSTGNPVIWLDADGCSPKYLAVEPSIILRSSPGNYQVFWPMNRVLEPKEAEGIVKRLSYYHAPQGCDTGGWQCNKFLRIPGTHNHKPERILPNGDRPLVEQLKFSPDRLDPNIFADIPELEQIKTAQDAQFKESLKHEDFYKTGTKYHFTEDYPSMPALPGNNTYPLDVVQLWNVRDLDDRSSWAAQMVKLLYQLNVPDEVLTDALLEHPIYMSKCRDNWSGNPQKIRDDIYRILESLRNSGVMPRLNFVKQNKIKANPTPMELELADVLAGRTPPDLTRKKIMSSSDIMNMQNLPWLIDGYIPQMAHINFFGPSGIGKSFQVLDWCIRIAKGMPWNGAKTHQGPVVYVVAEGLEMMGERLRAWQQQNMQPLPDREKLLFYGDAVQIRDTVSIQNFLNEITDVITDDPVLIVFDTLSQCMIGANENSAEDMSKVNGVLTYIRNKFGCATLVVHHTGHDGDHERGHSSFPASAATRIRIDEYMGHLMLECEKQRGGKEFSTVYVRRIPVPENTSRYVDGYPEKVLSLVLQPMPDAPKTLDSTVLNSRHLRILNVLNDTREGLSSKELESRSGLHERVYLRYKSELEQSGYVMTGDNQNRRVVITDRGIADYNKARARELRNHTVPQEGSKWERENQEMESGDQSIYPTQQSPCTSVVQQPTIDGIF